MHWLWLVGGLVIGFLIARWWSRRKSAPLLAAAQSETAARRRLADESYEAAATYKLEAQNLSTQLSESEGEKQRLAKEIESSAESLASANRGLVETQREVDAAISSRDRSESEVLTMKEEVAIAKEATAESEAKHQSVIGEFVELRRQVRRAEAERDEVQADRDGSVADFERRAEDAEVGSRGVQEELSSLRKQLSIAEARAEALGEASDEAAETHEELGRVRSALASCQAQVEKLEASKKGTVSDADSGSDVPESGTGESPGLADIGLNLQP